MLGWPLKGRKTWPMEGQVKKSEIGLLGIAQGGLPEAAPVEPEKHKPNETINTKWAKKSTC